MYIHFAEFLQLCWLLYCLTVSSWYPFMQVSKTQFPVHWLISLPPFSHFHTYTLTILFSNIKTIRKNIGYLYPIALLTWLSLPMMHEMRIVLLALYLKRIIFFELPVSYSFHLSWKVLLCIEENHFIFRAKKSVVVIARLSCSFFSIRWKCNDVTAGTIDCRNVPVNKWHLTHSAKPKRQHPSPNEFLI